MKRILSVLLSVVICMSTFTVVNVFAADDIKIIINGEEKTFDVMPQIVNSRTMVPMRGIFEALGAEVVWDDAVRRVYGKVKGTVVTLTINKTKAMVNGIVAELDVPAQIIGSRTFVPIRFIAESLGCDVLWDDTAKSVVITEKTEEEKKVSEVVLTGEKVTDPNLPDGGYVIISKEEMKANISHPNKKAVQTTINEAEGSFIYDIPAVPETQSTAIARYKKKLDTSTFNAGDTFLVKMEARLVSGGLNGKGYVKYQLQNPENNKSKAIFNSVSFGTEWETVYAPFTQLENCIDAFGFRVGLVQQKIEVKNIELITFGNKVKAEELPSSICDDPKPTQASTVPVTSDKVAETTNNTVITTVPDGGKTILEWDAFKSNLTFPKEIYVKVTKNDAENVYTFDVVEVPDVQSKALVRMNKNLDTASFAAGDTLLIKFEARLVSGGLDGKGYVKLQLQNPEKTTEKSIFKSVSFGSEWTTVYAPFSQRANCVDSLGFRVAPMIQKIEFRNFEVINFGTTVKPGNLPSSICNDPKQ